MEVPWYNKFEIKYSFLFTVNNLKIYINLDTFFFSIFFNEHINAQ